ncbi:DNA replication factor Cdt1-like [Acanthaster planci]|uniref:DNA replication factor Cdt1-like n=1 Tax=Acanthaster planci TaxID=133434 RepID=A0A8B7ZTN0_ACAPL|nr:DNA replication factor Cdt1-like [Acanthaster planci]
MAQVKVTSYYTRRKRIDDSQPPKRRKLQLSTSCQETDKTDSGLEQSDVKLHLKAGLDAFTKQVLPQVDRAVLLEDTVLQCSKGIASTGRPKSARKSRASATRNSKKKGPLDKHLACLERVTCSPQPSTEVKTDFSVSGSIQIAEFVKHHSPPSTPTKRSQQILEAPSRKKRCRIGSTDVTMVTDDSLGQMTSTTESSRVSRRKVRAAGRQVSKRTNEGRSAKKRLEASLQQFAKFEESDTITRPSKDIFSTKEGVASPHLCYKDNSNGITAIQCESHQTSATFTKTTPAKPEVTTCSAGPSQAANPQDGMLQAFIERTSRSVASADVKGSKVNERLRDRIHEAVEDVGSSPLNTAVEGGRSNFDGKQKTKLTPAAMKERLSQSCKLSDLQARLAQVKQCADRAKNIPKPAPSVNSDVTAGTSKPAAGKIRMEEPAVPAYQKYHALASSAPPTLILPYKYKCLEEMFRSTDTVVSMLHNRSETCAFPKLKQAVQEMCRRAFEHQHLGQIKTVYPTAYFLRQEKVGRTGVNQKPNYELVLEANTGSGVGTSAGQESSEPIRNISHSNAVSKLISKFTPSMLIARRSIFHNNLVDIVKEHHKEFLSKLERPLSVPSDKLTRWHPKFPLDQIPDIEPAALPKPPLVATYSTAKDVLDKARVMMNPRVAKALEVVATNSALLKAEKDKQTAEQQAVNVKREPEANQHIKAVSGVSQSLLDKIRAKEAHNLTAMMTRNPADQERIAMLERLPELCRILRVFFLSEKKAALPVEAVIQKLADSYPSVLSKAQVEKHVSLMVEVLPQWLSKVVVRKDHYLKMDKTKDMSQINDRVNQLLKENKQVKG